MINFIKKEFLFTIFFIILLVFIYHSPQKIFDFNSYISWATIRALVELLLITTAMKLSNLFDDVALKLLSFFKTEKYLALFFVFLTAILSMFLTNDITLFIIVPITLSISNIIKNDVSKLVFFEAISANVGSLLTPIGNPQNLYLFREWNISFLNFIDNMFIIFAIKFSILILFVLFLFPSKTLKIQEFTIKKIDFKLFISAVVLFVLFIIGLEFNFVKFLIPISIIWFLWIKKEVILEFDYFLILTFILMFIDFNLLSQLKFIKTLISSIDLNFINTLNLSVILSQFMSNVPAAIFVSKFSNDFEAIAYGSNIAGSGILIASLANIIAIRMLRSQKAFLTFHKYSLPYFIISYLSVLLYFKLTNIF